MIEKTNYLSTGTNTLNAVDKYQARKNQDAGEPEVQVRPKKESHLVRDVIAIGAISALSVIGAFVLAHPEYSPFKNKNLKQTPAQYVEAKYNTDQNIAESQAKGLYFGK